MNTHKINIHKNRERERESEREREATRSSVHPLKIGRGLFSCESDKGLVFLTRIGSTRLWKVLPWEILYEVLGLSPGGSWGCCDMHDACLLRWHCPFFASPCLFWIACYAKDRGPFWQFVRSTPRDVTQWVPSTSAFSCFEVVLSVSPLVAVIRRMGRRLT